jgi:predicted alpha/beta hydrolase family esterase
MKKSAIIIHGTEGFPEENWFPWLKEKLGRRGYEVTVPQFPSPPVVPAKIDEWFKVLLAQHVSLNRESLLIGHSLGGVFTLRILESLETPVRAAYLVGTPIGEKPILNYDRDVAFSGFTFDWQKIKQNAEQFAVFQSDNDPYVGLENGKQLATHLDTRLYLIPDAGHFNTKAGYTTFPDLLKTIDRAL